jgi:predicted nucleic acid-binding protein
VNTAPPFDGRRYLVDSSAWIKLHRTDEQTQKEFAAAIKQKRLAVCPVVLLEVLRGARPQDFRTRERDLLRLELVPTTAEACELARLAQGAMADARPDGKHQSISPGDFLIAGTADDQDYGVLHYDQDFDELQPYLGFESRWIAPRGSLS